MENFHQIGDRTSSGMKPGRFGSSTRYNRFMQHGQFDALYIQ